MVRPSVDVPVEVAYADVRAAGRSFGCGRTLCCGAGVSGCRVPRSGRHSRADRRRPGVVLTSPLGLDAVPVVRERLREAGCPPGRCSCARRGGIVGSAGVGNCASTAAALLGADCCRVCGDRDAPRARRRCRAAGASRGRRLVALGTWDIPRVARRVRCGCGVRADRGASSCGRCCCCASTTRLGRCCCNQHEGGGIGPQWNCSIGRFDRSLRVGGAAAYQRPGSWLFLARVLPAVLAQVHLAVEVGDALLVQHLQLGVPQVGCAGAVGLQHALPRQVVAVLVEDAAYQPWRRGLGEIGDVAVGGDTAAGDGPDEVADPFVDLLVHRASFSVRCPSTSWLPRSGSPGRSGRS